MSPYRCACCVCQRRDVVLMPFLAIHDIVQLTEGMCRSCLALAAPDRRQLLRQARLELRLSPGLAQIVLFYQAWEAVKMSALERHDARRAA